MSVTFWCHWNSEMWRILDVKLARSLISCSLLMQCFLALKEADSWQSYECSTHRLFLILSDDLSWIFAPDIQNFVKEGGWRSRKEGFTLDCFCCMHLLFFQVCHFQVRIPDFSAQALSIISLSMIFYGTTTVLMIKVNGQIISISSVFLSSEPGHAGN